MASALGSCLTQALTRQAFGSAKRARTLGKRTTVCAADRPLWLPGSKRPAWLDGSLAGDYGFDPLQLAKDPENLRWYRQAELIHARYAMAAVAGVLFPAILSKAGVVNIPAWYEAGKVAQDSSTIPFSTLLIIELFSFGFVEVKRWMDFRKPGSQGEEGSFLGFETAFRGTGENGYPGGLFDPLGLSRGSKESFEDYKEKEIKNGRLAMLAIVGFWAQYSATGKGPIDNLFDHLKNPALYNFTTNGVSLPAQAHPIINQFPH